MILFKTFKSWKSYCLSSVCDVCDGMIHLFLSLILGIISVVVAMWKSVRAFVRREFLASLICAILIGIILLGWLITFANERSARVYAEFQRDSLIVSIAERIQFIPNAKHYCDEEAER